MNLSYAFLGLVFIFCVIINSQMQDKEESVIVELSGYTSEQILHKIQRLLEEDEYERFTLFLRKKPGQRKKKKKSLLKCKSFEVGSFDMEEETFFINSNLQQKLQENTLKIRDCNLECTLTDSGKKRIPTFSQASKEQQTLDKSEFVEVARAINLYNRHDYDSAVDILQSLESDIIHENRLQHRNAKEQSEKNKITINVKMYSEVAFHLGNCRYRAKEIDGAIHYYRMQFADEDQKQKGQRLNNLGTCYAIKQQNQLSLKSYSEALKIYQKYSEIDCSNLLNNIGLIYLKSGMYETAAKHFSESINSRKVKSPQNQQMLYYSYFKMGICLKKSKKQEESLNSFLFAQNLAERGVGNYCQTLKELGLLYEIMEKWSEALTCYEKLSEYNQTEISQGYIYERVALLNQKLGNEHQFKKFMRIAYEEYKKEGNVRKTSDLSFFANKKSHS